VLDVVCLALSTLLYTGHIAARSRLWTCSYAREVHVATPGRKRTQVQRPVSTMTALPASRASSLPLPTKLERAQLFERFDENGNGRLSYGEVENAARLMWPEVGQKRVLMAAFRDSDGSGDGTLQRKEFRTFLQKLRYYDSLWRLFEVIDDSDDHRLTFDEFDAGMIKIGLRFHPKDELNEGFVHQEWERLDTGGDGLILFDDFCRCPL
jgi:hypothetical protein